MNRSRAVSYTHLDVYKRQIEVTTTVKPQEEGVKEYEVRNVVFIKAVRHAVNPVFGTCLLYTSRCV